MTDSTEDDREALGAVPSDTFALRLVIARHFAGRLSIEQAARTCGISPGNWAHWEDGRRPRDQVEVAQAISAGLQVSFDWLLLGGPLTPGRGRSTERSDSVTLQYREIGSTDGPFGERGNRRGSHSTVRPSKTHPKVRADPSRPMSPAVVGRRAAPVW